MNSHLILRRTTLILAVLLAAQCAWLLIPGLLPGGPDRLPTDPQPAAAAAKRRDGAAWAASIGAIRGDLWARSAFTYSDLLWNEDDSSEAFRQASQRADGNLERTFEYAPCQAGAWLLFAALASRVSLSGPKATAALKMAYYTGPSQQTLVPLRLNIAAQSADFTDLEMQQLVMRDLRLLLARQEKSAIVAAYDTASPAGRRFIEQSLGTIDPTALQLLPGGAKPEPH